MKDLIKRLSVGLVSGLFLGYLIFLFVGNTTIVTGAFQQYNIWYYVLLALILLVLFVFFGIYPVHFKMTKATLFVLGIFLILIGNGVLLNDPSKGIYIGDLFSVLGVVLALLAWTDLLITSKVLKKSKEKKVEIIEV